MPNPVVMKITAASFGVTLAGGATLVYYDCQMLSAQLSVAGNLEDVDPTFCSGPTQTATPSTYSLDLSILQDWLSDTTSLGWFAFDNDAAEVEWEIVLDTGATPTGDAVTMHGTASVVPFPFGGDAGAPLTADTTWPCTTKPLRGPWVATTGVSSTDETVAA